MADKSPAKPRSEMGAGASSTGNIGVQDSMSTQFTNQHIVQKVVHKTP